MSLKISAISDLHGYLPKIDEPADIMLIAGDIMPFEIQFNKLEGKRWLENDFAEWIKELPMEEVYMVAGNHDAIFESINSTNLGLFRQATNFKLKYLKNSTLVHYTKDGNPVKIFGTPYCSIFGNWPFMRTDEYMINKFKEIPDDVDIIISHDPPFALSDADMILEDTRKSGRGMIHLGNKPLAERVKNLNFKLLVCGHIHSGDHCLVNNCVNVSLRNEAMAIANQPFYYELEI